jgi:glycosyltransferase involved in cell wall biosynthesis
MAWDWLAKKRHQSVRRQIIAHYENHVRPRPSGLELFSLPSQFLPTSIEWNAVHPDVVHLHWLAFMADWPSFFASIPREVPVVWTLHDMNPLTGGCHYSGGCTRWLVGCGHCPQLAASNASDASRWGFQVKQRALRSVNLHIVSPSQWLCDVARDADMFPRQTTYHVIRYGIDLSVFRPVDPRPVRRELGVANDAVLVAFGAEDLSNRRKGFHLLVDALRRISTVAGVALECLIFGKGEWPADVPVPCPVHHTGFVDDPNRLSALYSAADFFVLPSLEDNQPQTGLEAMACGTPVVAFAAGGIPEYVIPRRTGLLAPVGNAAELARAIVHLAVADEHRQLLGRRARSQVEQHFASTRQSRLHLDLYQQLIAAPLHRAA